MATNVSNPIVNSGNASPADVALYLDPTAFTANTRTTKLRIRYVVFTNSTAPAITYTVGLYPIATYGGGLGQGPFVASVGTVVTGSTANIVSPGAAAATTAVTSDFNFPAAGQYLLGVAPSTTAATNSVQHHVAYLEMRQV